MRQWWNQLNARERWLVGIGGVITFLLLLYLLVWEPFQASLTQLRKDVEARRDDLAWMQQASVELRRLAASSPNAQTPATSQGSLLVRVDQSARQAQLGEAVTRVEPQGGNQVRIWLEEAPFDRVVQWLDTLAGQGVAVDDAIFTPGGDSGRVDARLVLQEASP
ncbi:MAG: type II secretion system protein M [Candidatus Competibacteraceae bacterium]|nr:type II secretion system protein M [Candidatus Competibacteraceae bacterium]